MEHKAPYALVGLFVCIVLVGLVGFLVWIEGGNDEDYKRYTVYFEDSVGGLQEGGEISYLGVTVGKVDALRLVPEDDNLVKVDIRVKPNVPVYKDTVGQLSTTGVTGMTHIELMPLNDTAKKEPVTVVEGEPYPVIEGRPSELSKALKALKDVPAITKEMKAFSGKLNDKMDKFDKSFIGKLTQ